MKMAILFVLFINFAASAAPILLDESHGELAARLWLPCSYGKCMIDTGGRGHLMAQNQVPYLTAIAQREIQLLSGPEKCDVLNPTNFELAGRDVHFQTFISCPKFNLAFSPTIGLPAFENSRFQFQFSRPGEEEFTWLKDSPNLAGSFSRREDWILIPVQMGDMSVDALFDTGAPVTLVDQVFFEHHKDLFSESIKKNPLPIGNVMELNENLKVLGHELKATTVMILDLKKSLGPKSPDVILGLAQIRTADWQFDLIENGFDLQGPASSH